jgi:hypothetical protein
MGKKGVKEIFVDSRCKYLLLNPDGTPKMGIDPKTGEKFPLTRNLSVEEVDMLRRNGENLTNIDERAGTGPGYDD